MSNEEKILEMLSNLTTGVVQIQEEQKITNVRLSELGEEQAKLEKDVSILKQDVQTLKNSVARIEYEHGHSLKALHDGYSMSYDISNEIRDSIKIIQARQEEQDIQIKVLKYQKKKNA